MKPGARVLAISLVGLALVAVVAWAVVGQGEAARSPELPVIAEESSVPLELVGEDGSDRSATEAAFGTSESPGTARTGTLLVRVVDDQTGRPVANVGLRVARERGGNKLLAEGATNESGEARFDAVEVNTVIVEALRKPPYARTFGAVWLEPREHKELELRLGFGATVTGRVVDDLGAPIAGVDILLDDDFAPRFGAQGWIHGSKAVSARSAADGRFELANLARAPSNVWIEKGAMKPESWSSPIVWLRFEDAAVPVQFDLRDVAEQDLGDIVIPRAATWSGHVLDARGEPVRGALVTSISWRLQTRRGGPRSGKPELAGWPGVAGFRLWPGETLSGEDGSFVLSGRLREPRVRVITTSGTSHECRVPGFEPGARHDGLELRIGDATVLVIELADTAGRRIVEPHPRSRSGFRLGQKLVGWRLQVELPCADSHVSTAVGADPDGLFRVQLDGAAGTVQSVMAQMAGYQSVQRTLTEEIVQPLRLVLEEMPVLRVRAQIAGQVRPSQDPSPHLEFQACLRDPAEWSALPEVERGSPGCCGLGVRVSIPYRSGVSDLELAVAVERPFYVRVRLSGHMQGDWSTTFGPWNPGEEWHTIEIPPPPAVVAPVRPDTEPVPARVRARFVDARSSEVLDGHVRFFAPSPNSPRESEDWTRMIDFQRGQPGWVAAPPGSWLMCATASGHEPGPKVPIELASDVEHDLGTFVLEPWPKVDVLVLDASGQPAPQEVRAHFADASGWSAGGIVRGKDGRLVLQAVVPSAGLVSVLEKMGESKGRTQTMPFAYDGSGEITVRLAPWRRVEVRIEVRDAPEREAWIDARIRRDPALDAERGPWQEWLGEGIPDVDARRFTGWATPGRYRLRCQSLLVSFPETLLDISASDDEVVRVELRPER